MIDQSSAPISTRTFRGLEINEKFWAEFLQAASDGRLPLDNCCLDISDATLNNVRCLEGLYPCILH